MTARRCPSCKTRLPIGTGVYMDGNHNVRCTFCDKAVVAAELESEIAETRPYPPHPAHRTHGAASSYYEEGYGD